ncbi:NAD(P)H-hydrate dehydratase [Microbacterium marinum]|uniref:ADP-dependent NAD(P)H-hydrate dehydratase n=1 Tax=Microbacterium marinum TaxID=421115 RepID=UPI00384E8477
MSNRSEKVGARRLRRWGLPDPGDSKKSRGRVIVVGGSRRSPGAVLLAGEAALRVGAGRLGVVVPQSIDAQVGIALPEAAVFALPDRADDPLAEAVADEVAGADAVLVGPGFDDPDQTRATLLAVTPHVSGCLVLDAFALGVLGDVDRQELPERLVLTPNREEASLLLGRDLRTDRARRTRDDLAEIARQYRAVVSCYGDVVAPDGRRWHVDAGGPGLGTAGSGDVLGGAVTGFAARERDHGRATVWATWAHATTGDRLTDRDGLGFLARDLASELALTLAPMHAH